MEIPQGYKWTELGVIPEDWEIRRINEGLANVKSGKRLPMGYYVTENQTSHPYIRVIDMYDGGVDISNIMYVPDEAYPAIENYRIFKEDIFISVAGSLGIVGKIPEKLDGANLTENANRLTNITCNRDYLLYFLRSPYIQNVISSEQTIGAQPKLALTRIRNFEIIVPKGKNEQQAIAEALSDVDALIAVLDKKIEKKRLIKQGAMQELLTGKKRLKGFTEPWKEVSLGDIGVWRKGCGLSKDDIIENGANKCIHYGELFAYGEIIYKTKSRTHLTSMSLSSGSDVLFPDSDVTPAGLGRCCALLEKEIILGNGINILTLNDNINAPFISYCVNLNKQKIIDRVTGTSVKHINSKSLSEVKINIPVLDIEQSVIASILSDMDKEIADLEARCDKYTQIKSGMMQKLLTGQIRLIQKRQARIIPLDAHIVAGHIVNKLHKSRGWGRTKLQKSLHLIGYHCQLDLGNEYIRNTAGPDDQQLMNYIDRKFLNYGHVRKVEFHDSVGRKHYNYVPTAKIDEIEFAFEQYPDDIQNRINGLLAKIERMDLGRAEIISTLYAVWNNRLIKHEPISDDLLLADFYAWSDHKVDFSRDLVLRGLDYMRQEGIIPTGWGKYIDKK